MSRHATNRITEIDADASGLIETPSMRGTPERNLLMAILERAILDFDGNDRKEVEAAHEWLFEKTDFAPAPAFSLPWICLQLDLELDKVRDTIKQMPKRGNRRVAPWYFENYEA